MVKGGRKRGKETKKAGLIFSLVCTLHSPKQAKLNHGRKPSVFTCTSFCCCCVGVFSCVNHVYVLDALVKWSFLAVLPRPRDGTDLCPPLARSSCLIQCHLHLRLSYKVGAKLCAFVNE